MLNEIEPVEVQTGPSTKIPSEISKPKVGEWYWLRDDEKDDKPLLSCAVHIGTNYLELKTVNGHEYRVHFKEFFKRCTIEPEYQKHIDKKTAHYRREIDRLTSEIKELTSSLGLAPSALPEGPSGVSALATRNDSNAVAEYKTALVRAKETTLPELFKQVKHASEKLATWLSATVIPLQACMDGYKPLIQVIESRIFNVELYAGLTETIECIVDGKPASIGEPVHLMQRRAYMDEECLAEYRVGGMEFENIPAFEKWLAEKENLNRLLPFPRCVLAFRVRRHAKEREGINIRDFIEIITKEEEDKATFLYIRNGERLYRLQTAIDFGSELFPDMNTPILGTEKVYAKMFCGEVREIITTNAYDAMVQHQKDEKRRIAALKKITPKKDHFMKFGHDDWQFRDLKDYVPFTPESVYYDDIEKHVQKLIEDHNRLVIVLQGLMDRSPVFHPHPKFSLWKQEDFSTAFKLIYDNTRALVDGDRPDFEEFRNRLNIKLAAGCVTVGQEEFWEIQEGARESSRLDNDWRTKTHYRPKRFRPMGNPGPGYLATVDKFKSGTCSFKWERERRGYRSYGYRTGPLPCSLSVPAAKLLNVSAYRPGMFKRFFADPRTRADYLVWAPFLLAAEEYHAGNMNGKPKGKGKEE